MSTEHFAYPTPAVTFNSSSTPMICRDLSADFSLCDFHSNCFKGSPMPQIPQRSCCTAADQSSAVREPAVEKAPIGSLATKLQEQQDKEVYAWSFVVKQYEHDRRDSACHGCDTVSEYMAKAHSTNDQPSDIHLSSSEMVSERGNAPHIVEDDRGYLLSESEDADCNTLVPWPKLWLHEAETILHIARVGQGCISQYRRYLEHVDDSRANFTSVLVGASPASDAAKYMLYNRASQLIDVTLSLKNQECWSAAVRWLQDKARYELLDTGRAIDELFQFGCDEALELQQHFREDAGDDEETTRKLVWDFLCAAQTQWFSELVYLVKNLETMLPHLSNPEPGKDELLKPEDELESESQISAKNTTDAGAFEPMVHEAKAPPSLPVTAVSDAVADSVVQNAKTSGAVVLSTHHYQLPTRSSLAKVKTKIAKALSNSEVAPYPPWQNS